jgi:hypothetical protein
MAKKGELSKTARASLGLGQRDETNRLTRRVCAKCGELITLKDLLPVKIANRGVMVYYHKNHFQMQ